MQEYLFGQYWTACPIAIAELPPAWPITIRGHFPVRVWICRKMMVLAVSNTQSASPRFGWGKDHLPEICRKEFREGPPTERFPQLGFRPHVGEWHHPSPSLSVPTGATFKTSDFSCCTHCEFFPVVIQNLIKVAEWYRPWWRGLEPLKHPKSCRCFLLYTNTTANSCWQAEI